jgi:hypothetical protein
MDCNLYLYLSHLVVALNYLPQLSLSYDIGSFEIRIPIGLHVHRDFTLEDLERCMFGGHKEEELTPRLGFPFSQRCQVRE